MIELSLDVAGPFEAGVRRTLALTVRATAPVLLEDATFREGSASLAGAPAHRWKRHPEGITTYDVKRDRYVHVASLQGVSAVPLHGGVVPAGGRAECFVAARLARGTRLELVVRYRALEPAAIAERLYVAPASGITGATVIYSRATGAAVPGGLSIVREEGLPLVEAHLSADVTVTPDAAAPAAGVARLRSLGWVVDSGGLVVGDLRLHGVSAAALDAIEALPPGDPLGLTFRGGAGSRVRDALALGDGLQAWLEPERTLELVTAVERSGARLVVGLPWEGLVIT